MELPHVGKQCQLPSCSQLDYLPFECKYCHKSYCLTHWSVSAHICPKADEANSKDRRLPTCPICNKPVVVPTDGNPNAFVNAHLESGCKMETKKSKGICSHKGCLQKTLIPVICPKCLLGFCVRHRLDVDHRCQGPLKKSRNYIPTNTLKTSNQSCVIS